MSTTGGLRSPLTPLIGREAEVAGVRSLLLNESVRLITITGPGGVGKTRLALQAAADAEAGFADGAQFVSLASIVDVQLVIPTLAQALGLRDYGARLAFDGLQDHLRDRRTLLLLDNFEQVVAAGPQIAALLEACGGVKALVTSREVLRLRGEDEYPLTPLSLTRLAPKLNVLRPESKPPAVNPQQSTMMQSPAVRLFVERTRAVRPDLTLNDQNLAVIAEICRRLDGLPLAIELAAARIRLLAPSELLARLDERSERMNSVPRDLPTRQRTLRDTMQWSYDLLDPTERRAFRWLAVFVSGCTLDAALEVWKPQVGNWEVDDHRGVVASLVDKSLLRRVEQADGSVRLAMLETIRSFAHEQLMASAEAEAAQRAHALYYLTWAEQVAGKLTTSKQEQWLDRLEADHDNLRAALQYFLDEADSEGAMRLGCALWLFWFVRGYLGEGRRWLALALATGPPAGGDAETAAVSRARAGTLAGAGTLATYQSDYAQAESLLAQALEIYRQLDDGPGLASTLNTLALTTVFHGDYAGAARMCAESVAINRGMDESSGIANALYMQAFVMWMNGDAAAARRVADECLGLFRELGDLRGVAFADYGRGFCALSLGDFEAARGAFDESMEILRVLKDRRSLTMCLNGLGSIALQQGDLRAAHFLTHEALAILTDLGDQWFIALSLEGLAAVSTMAGDSVRAARLFGAADALRVRIGAPLPPALRPAVEAITELARTHLDADAWNDAWAEGRLVSREQALAESARIALPSPAPAPAQGVSTAGLTSREIEVLRLVASGLTDAQVAERLVISVRTATAHMQSIYGKLGVKSRVAATRVAIEQKLA